MTDTPTPHRIRIVALQGSVRAGNNTAKALALVVDELTRRSDVQCEVIDPTDLPLAFPGKGEAHAEVRAMAARVRDATAVVLATPEYHGSFSSVLKLMIENLGFPSALAGKPVALLGVAAGQIGAIKSLEQLRSVCSHVGAIVLPGPVSVARVREVFDDVGRCTDERVEQRIRGLATDLVGYIKRSVCPAHALEAMVREAS
jgi:FMN reductase